MNDEENLLLDPQTIDGDYAEACQRWVHLFNKQRDQIDKCFKECAFVSFEPRFDPETIIPAWNKFAEKFESSHQNVKE